MNGRSTLVTKKVGHHAWLRVNKHPFSLVGFDVRTLLVRAKDAIYCVQSDAECKRWERP